MFARVTSVQSGFPQSELVTVETDVTNGTLYAFSVVGLPDKAVEEARDRMSSAIKHSGFKSPKAHNHKIVISLAPAEVKKEGAAFDLPWRSRTSFRQRKSCSTRPALCSSESWRLMAR